MAVRQEVPEPRVPIIEAKGREARLQQLKRLFPEAFTEGKVNFDKLKALLDEQDALATGLELYEFIWPGKNVALRTIREPSYGTLRPCPEESVEFDEAQNLFIEGDNLEVLKILRESYSRKIKMIYIDPPYNTGKEFIYPDNFREGLQDYLKYSGQVDDNGFKISTNTEINGRYHSRWLSMMYPRLYLARTLLRDDGVIFVSIDDNEVFHLRMLMNEIFGSGNFFATLTRKAMHTVRNSSKGFNLNADYILVYAKEKAWFEEDKSRYIRHMVDKSKNYTHDDNDGRGSYKLDPLHARNPYTPYEIVFGNGVKWSAPSGSYPRYSQSTLRKMYEDGRVVFSGKEPKAKRYFSEVQEGQPPNAILDPQNVGFNADGTRELRELLGDDKVFPQPKPSLLIKFLMSLLRDQNALVLDFFSGSCTTAHAVLALNAEDGGNRKFICIQLPEPCGEKSEAFKAGYKTIADIGKERIRRVIKKIEADNSGKLNLKDNGKVQLEQDKIGFKIFKLADSNFKLWEPGEEPDAESLTEQIRLFAQNLKSGRSEQDFLYELLLRTGQTLSTPIEEKEIEGQKAFFADEGALVICLGDMLTREFFRGIIAQKPEQVVCLDNSFAGDDSLKTNVVLEMKSNGIQFWTV